MQRKAFWAVVALLFVGLVSLQAGDQQSAPAPPQAPSAESPQALMRQYCVTCHNQRLSSGGLALDALDLDGVGPHAEAWEKVARKLRAGLMPPPGARRPGRSTLDALAGAVEGALDRHAASKPNPGRTPLHRMNRAEYGNAIRDLLALDVDPAVLLPADDSSHGFDNIADILRVSPALLERYVSAAAKVSRLAVGSPETAPVNVTYRLKGDLSQTGTVEGQPLGTRGGVMIRHTFPLSGEYVIRLSLIKAQGRVFGNGAEGEELEVTIDGRRVKLFKLRDTVMSYMREVPGLYPPAAPSSDPLEERAVMNGDLRLEFRVKVDAGPRDLSVAFIQKGYEAIEDIVRPPVASLSDLPSGIQFGYTSVPHLGRVDITGPYEATGPGDTPSRRRIFVCRPSTSASETACARQILSALVGRAYRRASTNADVDMLMPFYEEGRRSAQSFEGGIEMGLRRLLADPEFVFRADLPPAGAPAGVPYRIADTALASRLSFFLWSSIPDAELLAVATQGKLHEPATLERQTRRMLADPRARALVTNFAGQWLQLRKLKNASPDAAEFVEFDDNLRQAFQRETELLFESILREDRSVLDLLDADYTFANERLARHYGIPNVYGPDFRRVPVPSEIRRGLLGKGSLLLVTSNPNRTSPVQRGAWILESLLGSAPPPPPPDVPALEENTAAAPPKSVRERMKQHATNPVCATCHRSMDPIGLALENFDAVGKWRTQDAGTTIDPSGQLADGTPVDGPSSLRKALLGRPEAFVGTMTDRLLMYGLGRETKYYDQPTVRAILRDAAPNRYRFSDLVLGIVKSAPFQMSVAEADSN